MATKNRRLLVDVANNECEWRFEVEDIPTVPENGIMIKVSNVGVCHSDLHMAQPDLVPNFKFPRVFGHEIGGMVYAIGEDVSKGNPDFARDDRVIVYPWGNCNNCSVCHNDLPHCGNQSNPFIDHSGSFVYGVWRDGGFQNYVVVHDASFIIKVPDDIPMEVAALVPCSGITAYSACVSLKNSIDTAIRINGKATVGMMGAGGLALWAIQIIRTMYPEHLQIVAIDVTDEKLEDAKKQGADKTFKWGIKEEPMAVAQAFGQTIGSGLDGVLDFTGIADVQSRGFFMLNAGGTMSLIGLGKNPTPGFHLIGTILKAITIKGVVTGTRKMCRELFQLISAGKVKPPPITEITHDDVVSSLGQMKNNTIRGRHVVKM